MQIGSCHVCCLLKITGNLNHFMDILCDSMLHIPKYYQFKCTLIAKNSESSHPGFMSLWHGRG